MPNRNAETILETWAEGYTADECAHVVAMSVSSVYRILRKARVAGDPRAAEREYTPEPTGMAKANINRGVILSRYKEGRGIKAIAKETGCREEDVRAVIYEATKAGADTGLKIGGNHS